MKFTADKKYDWIFTSDTFIISNGTNNMKVRWTYDNMYNFSDYDKSTCPYTGLRCNFNAIALQYETECQGDLVWISYEDYDPTVTKKDMMELINNVTNELRTTYHD